MPMDERLLTGFENGLNPARPEKSDIPPVILGYGEISTTFSIPGMPDLAFKRLPPFENARQIASHKAAISRYCGLLAEKGGIRVVDVDFFGLENRFGEHILYVIQPRLPKTSIGHEILKTADYRGLETMMRGVLTPLLRLHQFNRGNTDGLSLGLDGQLSNWGFAQETSAAVAPVYFDITTPLLRENGRDQMDTAIFLKSCPSFLVWLVRWRFLAEVLDRYHDLRLVLVDLAANFYKEGRQDLIGPVLSIINARLAEDPSAAGISFLIRSEVDRYYQNDAFIWRLFLFLRRLDRFFKTRILRKRYNFILPGTIRR